MSTFAKGNPFSLFFGDPVFWDPFFSFFLFFLSPAKVGSLEMQPGAKLQAYLGVIILQPHACTQRFRLRILRRTRSNAGRTSAGSLSGRIESIWKTPCAASLMCCRLIQLAILFYGAIFFCRSAGRAATFRGICAGFCMICMAARCAWIDEREGAVAGDAGGVSNAAPT